MRKCAVACCVAVVLAVAGAGCVVPMRGSMMGPITVDHVGPGSTVDNSVRPLKRGESKAAGILFFVTGDASIQAAMKAGGITRVHHIDYDVKNILSVYSEVITIVYGE